MPKDFLQLGIRADINNALKAAGITEPTPIQEKTIPLLMAGKDVIAQSQTGTGKTLAFVLPILENINLKKPYIQSLVITPTRELALQITTEVKKLANKLGVNVLSAYGGQDVEQQVRKLKGNIHMIIATPGRLLDHLRRGTVQLTGVSMLVLDEADQMLHMGFLDDVEKIIQQTSPKRQTMLFSATMPQQIRTLASHYMRNPVDIRVQSKQVTLDEIKQIVVETTDRSKQDTICKMINEYQPFLAIIFCRTKRRASALNEVLISRGYNSDELHGDLSQAKREQVMKRFREAKLHILVATDVAARGLDVEGVTHVFNYDIPHDVDSYIHRIGRTGRAGETGVAITFVSPRDRQDLQKIEKGIGIKLEKRTEAGERLTGPSTRKTPVKRPGTAKDVSRAGKEIKKPQTAREASRTGKERKSLGFSTTEKSPRRKAENVRGNKFSVTNTENTGRKKEAPKKPAKASDRALPKLKTTNKNSKNKLNQKRYTSPV